MDEKRTTGIVRRSGKSRSPNLNGGRVGLVGLLDPAGLHGSEFLRFLEPLASPDENSSAVQLGVSERREKFLTRHGGRSLGEVSHLRRHREGNSVVRKIIHHPPEGLGGARGIEIPNDEKNPRCGADSRGEEVHHRIRENHREQRLRRKRSKPKTIARPPANRLLAIRPMNSSKDQRGIDGRRKIRIDLGGPFPAEVNELSLGQRLGRLGWTR